MAKSKAKNQGRARKQKGGSWEAKLAKDLTYYSSYENEFRRVVGSGAHMGGINRHRNQNINSGAQEALSGDILGPDGWCFSIECKNTKAYPRFHLMLLNGDPQVEAFLWESMIDAHYTQKIPLLAMKRTFQGEFMMVPSYLVTLALEEGINPIETWAHTSYIFRGPDQHPTDSNVPLFTKRWIMMDCAFFCFFVENFWAAGKKYLQELENDNQNKNDTALSDRSQV